MRLVHAADPRPEFVNQSVGLAVHEDDLVVYLRCGRHDYAERHVLRGIPLGSLSRVNGAPWVTDNANQIRVVRDHMDVVGDTGEVHSDLNFPFIEVVT